MNITNILETWKSIHFITWDSKKYVLNKTPQISYKFHIDRPTRLYYLLFCLFDWGLTFHSRIFHSYGDVTITGARLQFLTYIRHPWPLSSEGSIACHTYCDKGHPLTFIMFISKTPDTLICCRAFGSGAVNNCFYDLCCRDWDLNTQPSACEAIALTDRATAAVVHSDIKHWE